MSLCDTLKQGPGDASVPPIAPLLRPYETSKTYMNALNIGYLVKKTCLLVPFYFIRFRTLPVTHGTNLQSPS